ncbi:MAG: DUF5412 family protein [Oscillospiraceae bacterium]|nr:DUF5412 family protein [Oscillospiraceae bacterium]WMJ83368.1 DUF5412 family protein [Oscillospiraceae bacterium MB24-C1]
MKRLLCDKAKIKRLRTTALLLLFIAFCFYFFSAQRYRGEELIGTYPSPNGTYILTTYLNNARSLTVDFAVLGRVKNTRTHLSKNVYFKYHCSVADVRWPDDTTVVINDVVINVGKDVYNDDGYEVKHW